MQVNIKIFDLSSFLFPRSTLSLSYISHGFTCFLTLPEQMCHIFTKTQNIDGRVNEKWGKWIFTEFHE